jgi:hypothetical protein
MIEEVYPIDFEGVETYLAKGDKGERVGQYVLIYLIDSVESRDRSFGPPSGPSPEFSEEAKEALAKGDTLCTTKFTDYVVVGK